MIKFFGEIPQSGYSPKVSVFWVSALHDADRRRLHGEFSGWVRGMEADADHVEHPGQVMLPVVYIGRGSVCSWQADRWLVAMERMENCLTSQCYDNRRSEYLQPRA